MRTLAAFAAFLAINAYAARAGGAASDFDVPEVRPLATSAFLDAPTYSRATEIWRTPEDVNAWIGARFEYDTARSVLLSETQRGQSPGLSIHSPEEFFATPTGICVDLARFGVETLRRIAPELKPKYIMIEFEPTMIRGNVLRRHWVASFERDGALYFFADSKRPGYMTGPFTSVSDFAREYASYRGRAIVAFRELDSFTRSKRVPAARRLHADA